MSGKQWAIGVDLGGTKIEVAIVAPNGRIHDRHRVPTGKNRTPKAIVRTIAELVTIVRKRNQTLHPHAIGIGVAGQIERLTTKVLYAPNLKWKNVKLKELLEREVHLPVAVCNDVRAATWGEQLFGAGKGCKDLVCIFIGTGIGSGVICNGNMLDGANNTAGEVGHMTIDINGPICHCGNYGCFEALAGGWAIQRDARQAVRLHKVAGETMLKIGGGKINAINGKTVTEAARHGDKLAKQLVDNLRLALIAGTTAIVNGFGPRMIILGGGVIEGMPELIGQIEKGVKKYALPAAKASLKIVAAKLHNDSGVIGAAAYALQVLNNKKVGKSK